MALKGNVLATAVAVAMFWAVAVAWVCESAVAVRATAVPLVWAVAVALVFATCVLWRGIYMAAPMAASTTSTTNAMINILPVDERRGAVGGGGVGVYVPA